MFAIVDIAGFQEKVEEGMKLHVPTLGTEEGKTVTFDSVFLIANSDTDVKVGTPTISGASVEAKVLSNGKDKKIRVYKMNRRKRYRRTQGHRQGFTEIEVTKIKASGAAKAPAAKKETAAAKSE
ncbi:MAG: 50S ribosomal protein L21 [Candidatus Peribacteraceae bacterium]|jgi:large subunit ribosomal protein L21|nr:50S ribosomal protein L21 [Candidatus Peribacteraceae bacterium]